MHSIEKISQFLIFLSISPYLWYFLNQLVFSEPNLHARVFIFIQAYLWNHGASVTCVNDGNLKFWLRHRKEKALISLIVSFIMIGWKLLYRPECFIMHGVFYYLKNLFCNTWKFCKLCYHRHNILCISSRYLHSMEKMSFLIFLSILSYLWYFLSQLVFSEPNLHARIFIFTGRIHGIMGPCNLRKWRKFEILIAPSWRISFSVVTRLYHDWMKITISPRMFYNVWCFANCRF